MLVDEIWINDPAILFTKLDEFFPSQRFNSEAQLNAIVRCSLYISLVMVFVHQNPRYLLLFVFALALTFVLYTSYPYKKILPSSALKNAVEVPWTSLTEAQVSARDAWLQTLEHPIGASRPILAAIG